jgi:predicted nucleic acid-binding protein
MIFRRVAEGKIQAITSVVTLTEVLSMPIEKQQVEYEKEYREMLLNTEHIELLTINVAIAEGSARLRVKYHLRTPDAMQIASAIESGCDAFLTNDHDLRQVTEIKILWLDDLELNEVKTAES